METPGRPSMNMLPIHKQTVVRIRGHMDYRRLWDLRKDEDPAGLHPGIYKVVLVELVPEPFSLLEGFIVGYIRPPWDPVF